MQRCFDAGGGRRGGGSEPEPEAAEQAPERDLAGLVVAVELAAMVRLEGRAEAHQEEHRASPARLQANG